MAWQHVTWLTILTIPGLPLHFVWLPNEAGKPRTRLSIPHTCIWTQLLKCNCTHKHRPSVYLIPNELSDFPLSTITATLRTDPNSEHTVHACMLWVTMNQALVLYYVHGLLILCWTYIKAKAKGLLKNYIIRSTNEIHRQIVDPLNEVTHCFKACTQHLVLDTLLNVNNFPQ